MGVIAKTDEKFYFDYAGQRFFVEKGACIYQPFSGGNLSCYCYPENFPRLSHRGTWDNKKVVQGAPEEVIFKHFCERMSRREIDWLLGKEAVDIFLSCNHPPDEFDCPANSEYVTFHSRPTKEGDDVFELELYDYKVTLTAYWDFHYEDDIEKPEIDDYSSLDWDHPYFMLED